MIDGIWGSQCANATAQIYANPLCGLAFHEPIPTRLIQFRVGMVLIFKYYLLNVGANARMCNILNVNVTQF